MKKLIAAMVTLMFVMGMCACSGGNATSQTTQDDNNQVLTTTEPTEAQNEDSETDALNVRVELKEAMEDYVSAAEEYINALEEYVENPTDSDCYDAYMEAYNEYLEQSTQIISWASEDLTLEELEYYAQMTDKVARIIDAESEIGESTEESAEESTEAPTEETTEADSGLISPEFKKAMDSYEAFFAEYCDFMERYMENPADLTLLADYTSYLSQYEEMMSALEDWEDEDMNAAEALYYTEVMARVTRMLAEVAY